MFLRQGGYFFLFVNVRIAMTVVIRDKTKPENCKSCSKVMYSTAFTSPRYKGRKEKLAPFEDRRKQPPPLRCTLRGLSTVSIITQSFSFVKPQKPKRFGIFLDRETDFRKKSKTETLRFFPSNFHFTNSTAYNWKSCVR